MKPFIGILSSIFAAWAADDAAIVRIREAGTRVVAMIQSSQKNWFSKEGCYSCHQQVLSALAFRAARGHGIPVDEKAARADAVAAFGFIPISTAPCITPT